jgi:hypothetical protein
MIHVFLRLGSRDHLHLAMTICYIQYFVLGCLPLRFMYVRGQHFHLSVLTGLRNRKLLTLVVTEHAKVHCQAHCHVLSQFRRTLSWHSAFSQRLQRASPSSHSTSTCWDVRLFIHPAWVAPAKRKWSAPFCEQLSLPLFSAVIVDIVLFWCPVLVWTRPPPSKPLPVSC